MFLPIKWLEFERIKSEYMMKKMEQIMEIQALETQFNYYSQFFEPEIELQISDDNYMVALTQINHLDNPQPDFIQVCVGILKGDRSNFSDLKVKAKELIDKELLENYAQIFN
jgi:predicted NUDIX family phosphoesterase